MTKRRSFSDKFKARVALEALRGDKTTHEIAAKHKVHLLSAGVRGGRGISEQLLRWLA